MNISVTEDINGQKYVRAEQEPNGDAISREAEIKKLKEQPAKVYIDKNDYRRGYIDGVNQMVKELKVELQKPIECDDAISRQAVLKTLDDMDNVLDEDRTIENYKELLKECYEVLPPVNPQKTPMIDKSNFDQEQYKADLQCAYDCGKASVNPQEPKTDVLDKIRAEIAEYKDDKVIHDERNEMIDIVLDIIDKYRGEDE